MAAISNVTQGALALPVSQEVLKRAENIPWRQIDELTNVTLKKTIETMQSIAAVQTACSLGVEVFPQEVQELREKWRGISSDAKIAAISWVFERSKGTPLERNSLLGATYEAIWHLHGRPQGDPQYGEHHAFDNPEALSVAHQIATLSVEEQKRFNAYFFQLHGEKNPGGAKHYRELTRVDRPLEKAKLALFIMENAKTLAGFVYHLAGRPATHGDNDWGMNHLWDDPETLMLAVSIAKLSPKEAKHFNVFVQVEHVENPEEEHDFNAEWTTMPSKPNREIIKRVLNEMSPQSASPLPPAVMAGSSTRSERGSDSKDEHDGRGVAPALPTPTMSLAAGAAGGAAGAPASVPLQEFNPSADVAFQKHIGWTARGLSVEESLPKMVKNAQKAVAEHMGADPAYMGIEGAIPSMESLGERRASPLTFTKYECEAQGPRSDMEDAHFYRETTRGVLTGVFDGHGGRDVAAQVCAGFSHEFLTYLDAGMSPHAAFEQTIATLQDHILRNVDLEYVGSTAVVSYIDKTTGLIYTATLGDSEANIYRRQGANLKSIPLSCVRDWSSKNDAKRAANVLGRPSVAREWPTAPNPKYLRVQGVNVSRAFGDAYCAAPGKIGSFHKPKITVNKLQVGDMLVLACDGLKDYASETAIVGRLKTPTRENPAEDLTMLAFENPAQYDNVTVLAIRVGE